MDRDPHTTTVLVIACGIVGLLTLFLLGKAAISTHEGVPEHRFVHESHVRVR